MTAQFGLTFEPCKYPGKELAATSDLLITPPIGHQFNSKLS